MTPSRPPGPAPARGRIATRRSSSADSRAGDRRSSNAGCTGQCRTRSPPSDSPSGQIVRGPAWSAVPRGSILSLDCTLGHDAQKSESRSRVSSGRPQIAGRLRQSVAARKRPLRGARARSRPLIASASGLVPSKCSKCERARRPLGSPPRVCSSRTSGPRPRGRPGHELQLRRRGPTSARARV